MKLSLPALIATVALTSTIPLLSDYKAAAFPMTSDTTRSEQPNLVKKVQGITIKFLTVPAKVIANQPTKVVVRIERANKVVQLKECKDCQLILQAPDGQQLNVFAARKQQLNPIDVDRKAGFAAQIIFGAPGTFTVRVQGIVKMQKINVVFAVPVAASR